MLCAKNESGFPPAPNFQGKDWDTIREGIAFR